MKKAIVLLAALLIVPAMATAGNFSANLDGGGDQGFASIVTSGNQVTYSILTNGLGTPTEAVILQGNTVFLDFQANFANGSASGSVMAANAGSIDTNPGAFSLRVSGPDGEIEGDLEDAGAGGGGPPPPPPPPPPPTGGECEISSCVEDGNTLCIQDDRFEVTLDFDPPQGSGGAGNAVELTDDTGYFWFFDAANVESFVKVVDACNVPGFETFWVFAGGLTDLRVEINVCDTETGVLKTYNNPQRTPFRTVNDTAAFDTCP